MNKRIVLSFVTFMSYGLAIISFIWIVIAAFCWLVNDHPFNWWCIWIFLLSIIVIIVSSTFFSKLPVEGNSSSISIYKGLDRKSKKKMTFIPFTTRDEYFCYYVVSMTDKGIELKKAVYVANKICNAMRSRQNFRGLYIEVGRIIIGSKSIVLNGLYSEKFKLKDGTLVKFSFYSE